MTRLATFEQADGFTGQLQHWAYNAADAAGTREIANVLLPRLRGRRATVYAAERAFQNPAFAMGRRGILVDQKERARVLDALEGDIAGALAWTDQYPTVAAVWDGQEKETGACPKPARKDGKHKWEKWPSGTDEAGRKCSSCGASRFRRAPFNANSTDQLWHLFYDLLGVPVQTNKKGQEAVDHECLEKIARKRPDLAPIVGWEPNPETGVDGQGVLFVKSLAKQRGEVKAPLSRSGRYLSTFNIGAAWTGRPSSSKGYQGLGGNLQNKAERLRRMFIADPGYLFVAADLKQAESLDVAYEGEDEAYIEAHLTGDLHTYTARVLFPDLDWSGDIKEDARRAKAITPEWDPAPGHNLRFQAKRNTHGYGYGISPDGTARIVHIKVAQAREGHEALDRAFPGIKNTYQRRVRDRVTQGLPIVTPLGREIQLMGRPWDKATWRQGYSASPQATVADLVWIAAYNLYKDYDPELLQLLQNNYDSLLVQTKEQNVEHVVHLVKEAMEIPVAMPGGRTMIIPVEIATGANWGKAGKVNPTGLKEWPF